MRLEVLDSVTDPAKPGAENDDRIGWNASAAFVIDGATGLGDPVMAPPASDAAWLAEQARRSFETDLVPERAIGGVVRDLCTAAGDAFFAAAGTREIERYRYPNAAFQALRITADGIETAGLADCALFLRDGTGDVTRYSGAHWARGNEQQGARQAIQTGGFDAAGEGFRRQATLDDLRGKRARLNSDPKGTWTLGVVPEAGAHVRSETLAIRLPALGVLCTDGFADLVDNYRLCGGDELIARAEAEGLALLLQELRHIERVIDPEGARFPRYKRCDDASAILVQILL